MLNTTAANSEARQPRAIVRLNGAPLPAWVSWEVSQNTYYEADTFRVSFAAGGLGTQTVQPFIEQKELFVEVLAGFPADPAHPDASELDSLIYGRVDEIEFEPVTNMLTLTGRDLTAAFIDERVTDEWQNKTASDIASELASKHTLVPVVTATTTKVGTYYKRDQVRMQANQSEWDLLAWLAREEGFVCYVSGQELHFEPDTSEDADPYVIEWQPADAASGWPSANAMDLHFSRSLTVSKGVSVTVRSPSTTKKTATVESYPGKAKAIRPGKSSPFGGVQTYYFTLPANKTPAECQREAAKRYNEIIEHEMKMTARLPGDNDLTTRARIVVVGTDTAFDQVYYPHEITRSMSMDEGYTMSVNAKNHSPDLQKATTP